MKPYDAFIRRSELGLTPEMEVLIDIVRQKERTTVMDLMEFAMSKDLASYGTVHKAIKKSIELKFLKLEPSPKDGRIKFCTLSKKGIAYLEQL